MGLTCEISQLETWFQVEGLDDWLEMKSEKQLKHPTLGEDRKIDTKHRCVGNGNPFDATQEKSWCKQ